MRYIPIHVDTMNKTVLIVGGSDAAEAKLRSVVKTESLIKVVSPLISPEIQRWLEQGRITWIERGFKREDLKDVVLAYVATDNDVYNRQIAMLAKSADVLVNVADVKGACSFITPALIDRDPVVVSIGTEGTSPGLARAIKAEIEMMLPEALGKIALKTKALREEVKELMPSLSKRQAFWANIFGAKDLSAQLSLSEEELERRVKQSLAGQDVNKPGSVTLVGAGPGNADLLTLGARRALHTADVIVYDRLVSAAVLDFGRKEAEYIYVGKNPHGKSTPQDDINEILVQKAQEGALVVRLKGGDPLIFGRADEELDAIAAAGVNHRIIPGITSAAAAAASIGMSLTARGHNKSIAFITGHDTKGFAEQDWKSLAMDGKRAAVYMGVGASRFIQGRLLLHDADPSLDITIVENASRENELIVHTTLAELADSIEANGIIGPAILLIGYAPRTAQADSQTLQVAS